MCNMMIFSPISCITFTIYIRPKVVTFSTARSGFNRTGTGAWTAWTLGFAASRLGARLEGISWQLSYSNHLLLKGFGWYHKIHIFGLILSSKKFAKKKWSWKRFMNCSHLERFFGGNFCFLIAWKNDFFGTLASFLSSPLPVNAKSYVSTYTPKGVLWVPND